MELIFGMIFLMVVLATSGIYFSDRSGWNATFKRISRMTRASLESKKEAKLLEKLPQTEAKDAWTAQFNGKAVTAITAPALKHEIVQTWFGEYGGSIVPQYKCRCGYKDFGNNVEWARKKAATHVKEQNAAEVLLTKNGGTHAW